MMMTNESHARILQAYLARLSDQAIKRLAEQVKACSHAGYNLGTSSQVAEHLKMQRECSSAIAGVYRHDLETIEKIIDDERL